MDEGLASQDNAGTVKVQKVLAYHLVHTIWYRPKLAGIHSSWNTLRNILLPHCRVTVTMRCENGDTVHVRKGTRPEPEQQ